MRAARHYEGAGQLLIRRAVMSAQRFVSSKPVELPAPGQWVVAECPARVDFSGEPVEEGGVGSALQSWAGRPPRPAGSRPVATGGWSDTPPLAYELGGAVLGLAVQVDGRRPIGARARRIPEPELRLAVGPRQDQTAVKIVCCSLDDMRGYCQPQAPGQRACDVRSGAWGRSPIACRPQRLGLRGALQSPAPSPHACRRESGLRAGAPEPAGPVKTGEGVSTAAGLSSWRR